MALTSKNWKAAMALTLLIDRVDELASLESGGFIRPIRNQMVQLTDLGMTVCDMVTTRLLPD